MTCVSRSAGASARGPKSRTIGLLSMLIERLPDLECQLGPAFVLREGQVCVPEPHAAQRPVEPVPRRIDPLARYRPPDPAGLDCFDLESAEETVFLERHPEQRVDPPLEKASLGPSLHTEIH